MKNPLLQLFGGLWLPLMVVGCQSADPELVEREVEDWRLAPEPVAGAGAGNVTLPVPGDLGFDAGFDGVESVALPGAEPAAERNPTNADGPVFLGQVTLVNDDSRFVLIKTPMSRRLKPGFPLQSFHQGKLSSELRSSPEQTFGFMTADIAEGQPQVGDDVYLRYTEQFPNSASPRMQQAMEQFEREQNMSFFEKRKYQRSLKKQRREKLKKLEEDQP